MSSVERSTGALIVDLAALARNFATVRAAAAPAECAAVVKANAYGLGVAPVVERLLREGCRKFYVAKLAEAEEVRRIAPGADIYVFEGVIDSAHGDALAAARLTPVLNCLGQVETWASREQPAPAVIHIDTGISRLGLSAREVETLARDVGLLSKLTIAHVLTHFACADEPAHPLNGEQLQRFEALRRLLPAAPTSIANSAGTLGQLARHGDIVRAGIALYGGNPFGDRANPMEPVATLRARILQIREVDEALTVGYGATYEVKPPARLATLGIGYADGYLRALSNIGSVAVAGRRAPIVGRVSMDLTCVDVSGLPANAARAGDWVELFGREVLLDDVASAAATISYEILTRLGPRLRREYVG